MYKGIFYISGSICILYFIMLSITTGFAVLFNFIWLFSGAVLFLFGSFKSRKLKKLSAILTVSALIFSSALIIPVIRYSYEVPEDNAEYVIVLGAEVRADNTPSPFLKHRLMEALSYCNENPDSTIIVSGSKGSNENISEALCMKNWLVQNDIDENRIIMDEKADNTEENILYSKDLIGDSSKKTVIVTQDFHMYRSLSLAREHGFSDVSGLCAKTALKWKPNYYLREGAAIIRDVIL